MEKIRIKIPKIKKITAEIKPIVLPVEGGYNQGYNDGYKVGKLDGEKDGFDKGYENGFTDGQESVPDMLEYVSSVHFPSCNVFGKENVELNLGERITTLASFVSLANYAPESDINNTVKHLTINTPALPTSLQGFMMCSYSRRDQMLKKLTLNFNTEKVAIFSNAFNCLIALEEIDGTPLDLSSATTVVNMFNYNNNLKEVRFKPSTISISLNFSYISKLSAETVQSIIDGLATITTAQTITFHSSIGLTDEQKATIEAKGWTLVQ